MKTIHHVPAIETLTIVELFLCWGADPRTTDLSFCAVIGIKEIILTILFITWEYSDTNNPPHGRQHLWNESDKLIYALIDLQWVFALHHMMKCKETSLTLRKDTTYTQCSHLMHSSHFRMIFTGWANMNDITNVCVCVCVCVSIKNNCGNKLVQYWL